MPLNTGGTRPSPMSNFAQIALLMPQFDSAHPNIQQERRTRKAPAFPFAGFVRRLIAQPLPVKSPLF